MQRCSARCCGCFGLPCLLKYAGDRPDGDASHKSLRATSEESGKAAMQEGEEEREGRAADPLTRKAHTSRNGENPPCGILGGTMETSASFEARYAPSSYSTLDPTRPVIICAA